MSNLPTITDDGRKCGNCRFLVQDRSHPLTDGGRVTQQRGWVCVGFLMCEPEDFVFSGWSENGLCELHQFRGTAEGVQQELK